MHKTCARAGCGRRFPWGITSADGVCFVCRWPKQWSVLDQATYEANLSKLIPAKAEPK